MHACATLRVGSAPHAAPPRQQLTTSHHITATPTASTTETHDSTEKLSAACCWISLQSNALLMCASWIILGQRRPAC
eukprot:6175081-Pleurochrysis_carterae.AAC.8